MKFSKMMYSGLWNCSAQDKFNKSKRIIFLKFYRIGGRYLVRHRCFERIVLHSMILLKRNLKIEKYLHWKLALHNEGKDYQKCKNTQRAAPHIFIKPEGQLLCKIFQTPNTKVPSGVRLMKSLLHEEVNFLILLEITSNASFTFDFFFVFISQ